MIEWMNSANNSRNTETKHNKSNEWMNESVQINECQGRTKGILKLANYTRTHAHSHKREYSRPSIRLNIGYMFSLRQQTLAISYHSILFMMFVCFMFILYFGKMVWLLFCVNLPSFFILTESVYFSLTFTMFVLHYSKQFNEIVGIYKAVRHHQKVFSLQLSFPLRESTRKRFLSKDKNVPFNFK